MDFSIYDDDIVHGSADVFGRGTAREAAIWSAFQFNGPFPALHATERTMLFGIYANTYLHGMNYLHEIDDISLTQMIENYDNAVARLEAEETQFIIENLAKEYIEAITKQIHEQNMLTGEQRNVDLIAEYESKVEALEADRDAIVTKTAELALAKERVLHRIAELGIKIELEGIAFQMAEVEISEQELRAAKTDLELIEAGIRGLNIQLELIETGIAITNTELQIDELVNEEAEVRIRIAETEVNESEVDIDILNAGINLSKSRADYKRITHDIKIVDLKIPDVKLQVEEAEAKPYEIRGQIAEIRADILKLELIDSEETLAQADKDVAIKENELLVDEKNMIIDQKQVVIDETTFVTTQATEQELLDEKILENDQGEHDFAIRMSEKEDTYEGETGTTGLIVKRLNALEAKKGVADTKDELRQEEADYRKRLFDMEEIIKKKKYRDEVSNFKLVQDADIVNTLTHSIGQA